MLLAGTLAIAACGAPTSAEPREPIGQTAAGGKPSCGDVRGFYAARPSARIWVTNGRLTQKGRALAAKLGSTGAGAPAATEQTLASAFVQNAGRLSGAPQGHSITYVDAGLAPRPPCAAQLLATAAQLPRIEPLLDRLDAPNIAAVAIKAAHAAAPDNSSRERLAADLALARSFGTMRRAILVDTRSARLWAIDGNRVADSMKVIVGKPTSATPDMAALLRYAKLKPYWDVPPDLVQMRIARQVAQRGLGYLQQRRFVVVDRYGEAPKLLSPAAIDWRAVRSETQKIGIRQLPGADNMLGRVLFMFPNRMGIYLHDTPNRASFARADRHISNGCVRLERAAALYRWSFGHDLPAAATVASPDQRVDLREPIPVYLVKFSTAGSNALLRLSARGAV